MTNEEKIKSMSTKELANKLYGIVPCNTCPISKFCTPPQSCIENWERWLKSEVGDGLSKDN